MLMIQWMSRVDAVAKLTDLEASLLALIAAGKLVENPESSFTSSVTTAVACINTANAG